MSGREKSQQGATAAQNDDGMIRNRLFGLFCLVVGLAGAGVVLFTEATPWLLDVGGPYLGMFVGTLFVLLALAGFALLVAKSD